MKVFSILFYSLTLLFKPSFAEEPWDIRNKATKQLTCKKNVIAEALISFHQEVISPIDGPRSNFRPSSSQYMLNAIEQNGFFLGVVIGCDRLLRENGDPSFYDKVPFDGSELKWDPVDGKTVLNSSESVY
jgi:putative component of membrane protein insertase Oxa1/YidC/SpoIIIJ protein YidD